MKTLGNIFNVFNSSVNFIIYYWMLKRFRDVIRALFQTWSMKIRGKTTEMEPESCYEPMDGNTSVAALSQSKVLETNL